MIIAWEKDCECERVAVTYDPPAIRGVEEDGAIEIACKIRPYHCATCGSPWKRVETPEEQSVSEEECVYKEGCAP